ncbi:MAG: Flagellar capping protein FliD [Thermodesulfobacterium sp.]|uniref:Flagellar hook-associated protein 2 n=1 Tax=Candidatus Thermodesulfobacterium syntrophicum TaxID=3060442 RepID=A0AAE3TEZ2_9BACT|nr:Flagellar capping protein FliD [Candidatus Thermodesulfobacterium syntrophicum]
MADIYMSNITGLLDVDSIIQGLLQSKTQDIQDLQNEKAILQAQSSSLSNLLGALNDLNDFVETLNVSNLFTGKSVTVGDPDILSATAESDTPNIDIRDLTVSKLSQEEIRTSSTGVTDLNSTIDSATFTLRYWTSDTTYEETEINFSGGTLQDLVDAINSSQDKIEASILFDGTYYKLMLSEKDVGNSTKETATDSFVIEISSGNLPTQLGSLETLQSAQNAEIQIGSNTFSSPSNTFEDIISGLTITVYQTGTTYISVEDDYSQVSSSLNDLLGKINSVIDLVNSQTTQGGVFQGNVIITQIKPQIFSQMSPLINLGIININDDGMYSLNTETLNNLIETDLETLQSAISEVKTNFSSTLEGLIDTINTYKSTQDQQIERINEEIEELQQALIKEEEKLRLEFSKIEALMYQNEQLRTRLESMVTPISEILEQD